MKTYCYCYDYKPNKILDRFCHSDDLLYIDIETTGLSPLNSHIYLIGVGYYDNDQFKVIQWFAESVFEERNVINAFYAFTSSYRTLLHFNGDRFDIPFIIKRAEKLNIKVSFEGFNKIDIYKLIKPMKSLLGLQDIRQKTVELFLQIDRKDEYNGGELIPIYKQYIMHPKDDLLELLLLHNEEDVLNMHKIIPIIEYSILADVKPVYKNHYFNTFEDFYGNTKEELIINYKCDIDIPQDIKSNQNGTYIYFRNDGTLLIRVPVIDTTLKLYYEDTANYYYLPDEDTCIHKSVATAVSKDKRKRATKKTCYTRHHGSFIPCFLECTHLFRDEYNSKETYIEKMQLDSFNPETFSAFASALIASKL